MQAWWWIQLVMNLVLNCYDCDAVKIACRKRQEPSGPVASVKVGMFPKVIKVEPVADEPGGSKSVESFWTRMHWPGPSNDQSCWTARGIQYPNDEFPSESSWERWNHSIMKSGVEWGSCWEGRPRKQEKPNTSKTTQTSSWWRFPSEIGWRITCLQTSPWNNSIKSQSTICTRVCLGTWTTYNTASVEKVSILSFIYLSFIYSDMWHAFTVLLQRFTYCTSMIKIPWSKSHCLWSKLYKIKRYNNGCIQNQMVHTRRMKRYKEVRINQMGKSTGISNQPGAASNGKTPWNSRKLKWTEEIYENGSLFIPKLVKACMSVVSGGSSNHLLLGLGLIWEAYKFFG